MLQFENCAVAQNFRKSKLREELDPHVHRRFGNNTLVVDTLEVLMVFRRRIAIDADVSHLTRLERGILR